MSRLTFQDRFERVQEHLVGLWKFRVPNQIPRWCCTYVVNGLYHDTWPKETKELALDAVYRSLKKLGEV